MRGLLYLVRVAAVRLGGGDVCFVSGCPEAQIYGVAKWCRLHTDAILANTFPECAARLEHAGLDRAVLYAEVEAELDRRRRRVACS